MYICMYIYIYIDRCICTNICIQTYLHIHIHIHMRMLVQQNSCATTLNHAFLDQFKYSYLEINSNTCNRKITFENFFLFYLWPSKKALMIERKRGRASVLRCDFLKPSDKSLSV